MGGQFLNFAVQIGPVQYIKYSIARVVKATEFLDRRTGEFPTTRRSRLKQVFDDIMFALSLF